LSLFFLFLLQRNLWLVPFYLDRFAARSVCSNRDPYFHHPANGVPPPLFIIFLFFVSIARLTSIQLFFSIPRPRHKFIFQMSCFSSQPYVRALPIPLPPFLDSCILFHYCRFRPFLFPPPHYGFLRADGHMASPPRCHFTLTGVLPFPLSLFLFFFSFCTAGFLSTIIVLPY